MNIRSIFAVTLGLIVFTVFLGNAETANAQSSSCYITQGGRPVCENVTIDRLIVQDNGRIYVATSADESGLSTDIGCAPLANVFLIVEENMQGRERILSLLLTAHERRRPLTTIGMNLDGSCSILYVSSEM